MFHTKLLTVNFDRYHSPFLKMNSRQSSLSLYFLAAPQHRSDKRPTVRVFAEIIRPHGALGSERAGCAIGTAAIFASTEK